MTAFNGSVDNVYFWNPESYLQLDYNPHKNYALIILNRPITCPPEFLIPFWNKAVVRITVDGGTDRWIDFIKNNSSIENETLPIDIICGDFDSILDETLNGAKECGIAVQFIYQTIDQNETDFTKSLRVLEKHRDLNNIKFESIFAICQSSGRLDQIMANINTLYKCIYQPIVSLEPSIYLISNDSISWILNPGEHSILVPNALRNAHNSWCGLIPVGEKCCNISTTGLKWNLENADMQFGFLVSTSNKFDGSDTVTVKNSTPVFWCMSILPIFSSFHNISDKED